MSSVVGLDIGNISSKIGVARARGVDIVSNEVSNRATPSLVSFGQKARALGEGAATAQTSNFKNTVGSLKRLIGRTFQDPSIQQYEKPFVNAELVDAKGEVGVKVRFLGEERIFSATQLLGMYLGKLRDTTQRELGGSGVSDVVLSVPIWFTDNQRRAMLNAAEIANLNPLRVMNEPTAVALGYGITKTDLPEPENPRNVIFVDVGHSSYQVSVVAFCKGQLTVLGAWSDPNFGGRNFDRALMEHFAEEFKGKYKIDVFSNPKSTFRLAAGCERLKKVLSANTFAQLNVESLMNDIDAASQLKREEFESMIAPTSIASMCLWTAPLSSLASRRTRSLVLNWWVAVRVCLLSRSALRSGSVARFRSRLTRTRLLCVVARLLAPRSRPCSVCVSSLCTISRPTRSRFRGNPRLMFQTKRTSWSCLARTTLCHQPRFLHSTARNPSPLMLRTLKPRRCQWERTLGWVV